MEPQNQTEDQTTSSSGAQPVGPQPETVFNPEQSASAPPAGLTQQAPDAVQPTAPVANQAPNSPFTPPETAPGKATTGSSPNLTGQPEKKSRKPIILAGAGLLLAAAAVYVLMFYLPSRPENVWRTGVNRSGEVLDELVSRSTTEDHLAALEQSEVTANFSSTYGQNTYQGALNTKFSPEQSDINLDITVNQDSQELVLGFDVLSKLTAGQRFPDLYFRVSGMSEFNLGALSSEINKYDDQWIFLSSQYFETLSGTGSSDEEFESNSSDITAQESADLANAVVSTANDYVFSTDEEKAVLVNKEFVGHEEIEGVKTYHYVVGLNPDNAVKFCKALAESVFNTEAAKKFAGNPSDEEVQETINSRQAECDELKDSINEEESFDVWIDSQYKLFHRLRFYDQDNRDRFVDIGQNYTGGDEASAYVDFSNTTDDLEEGRFTLGVNLANLTTKGELKIANKDKDNPLIVNADFEVKPYPDELDVQPPADAIDIEKLWQDVGSGVLGSRSDDSSIQQSSWLDWLPQ